MSEIEYLAGEGCTTAEIVAAMNNNGQRGFYNDVVRIIENGRQRTTIDRTIP
jgi:hypothetical protein